MRLSTRFLVSRKFWQRTLFAGVCLATLLGAALLAVDFQGRAAWASYQKEARARGVKLSLKEFSRPVIPEAENFGAAPSLADLLSADPEKRARAVKASEIPKPVYFAASMNPGDFIKLRQAFETAGWKTAMTDDPLADVLAVLSRFDPIITPLRAALDRPGTQLPRESPETKLSDLDHLVGLLDLSKLLGIRIPALLKAGRTEQALEEWRVQMRLASLLESEPGLIAVMLRLMLLVTASNGVGVGLDGHHWNETQLLQIEAQFSRVDLEKDFISGTDTDRAWGNFAIDERERTRQPLGFYFGAHPPGKPWNFLFYAIPKGWFESNKVHYNQMLDQLMAETRTQGIEAAFVSAKARVRKIWWLSKCYWPLAGAALDFSGGTIDITRTVQTQLQRFRIEGALQRHHLHHGAYPPNLESLVPGELAALPRDAYGNAFVYRLLPEEQFALYSMGENRRDEGGDGDDLSRKRAQVR